MQTSWKPADPDEVIQATKARLEGMGLQKKVAPVEKKQADKSWYGYCVSCLMFIPRAVSRVGGYVLKTCIYERLIRPVAASLCGHEHPVSEKAKPVATTKRTELSKQLEKVEEELLRESGRHQRRVETLAGEVRKKLGQMVANASSSRGAMSEERLRTKQETYLADFTRDMEAEYRRHKEREVELVKDVNQLHLDCELSSAELQDRAVVLLTRLGVKEQPRPALKVLEERQVAAMAELEAAHTQSINTVQTELEEAQEKASELEDQLKESRVNERVAKSELGRAQQENERLKTLREQARARATALEAEIASHQEQASREKYALSLQQRQQLSTLQKEIEQLKDHVTAAEATGGNQAERVAFIQTLKARREELTRMFRESFNKGVLKNLLEKQFGSNKEIQFALSHIAHGLEEQLNNLMESSDIACQMQAAGTGQLAGDDLQMLLEKANSVDGLKEAARKALDELEALKEQLGQCRKALAQNEDQVRNLTVQVQTAVTEKQQLSDRVQELTAQVQTAVTEKQQLAQSQHSSHSLVTANQKELEALRAELAEQKQRTRQLSAENSKLGKSARDLSRKLAKSEQETKRARDDKDVLCKRMAGLLDAAARGAGATKMIDKFRAIWAIIKSSEDGKPSQLSADIKEVLDVHSSQNQTVENNS